jgi:DNA-binding NtrC family response regulator
METITVLIIDDGDDLLRFCQQFMPTTYRFIHARTGPEGLRILETSEIKLVMLDKSFDRAGKEDLVGDDAENEGMYILEMLHRDHPHIPVMMITAHADAASQHKALELDVFSYFSWDTICANPQSLRKAAEEIVEKHLLI